MESSTPTRGLETPGSSSPRLSASATANAVTFGSSSTSDSGPFPCLKINLLPPPDYLAQVLKAVPEAEVSLVSDREEAIGKTRSSIHQLRGLWGVGDGEAWKELDGFLVEHGYPTDPSKSITNTSAAIDVLQLHFRKIATQATSSQLAMDNLTNSIKAVKAFTLASAHANVQKLYVHEFEEMRTRMRTGSSTGSLEVKSLNGSTESMESHSRQARILEKVSRFENGSLDEKAEERRKSRGAPTPKSSTAPGGPSSPSSSSWAISSAVANFEAPSAPSAPSAPTSTTTAATASQPPQSPQPSGRLSTTIRDRLSRFESLPATPPQPISASNSATKSPSQVSLNAKQKAGDVQEKSSVAKSRVQSATTSPSPLRKVQSLQEGIKSGEKEKETDSEKNVVKESGKSIDKDADHAGTVAKRKSMFESAESVGRVSVSPVRPPSTLSKTASSHSTSSTSSVQPVKSIFTPSPTPTPATVQSTPPTSVQRLTPAATPAPTFTAQNPAPSSTQKSSASPSTAPATPKATPLPITPAATPKPTSETDPNRKTSTKKSFMNLEEAVQTIRKGGIPPGPPSASSIASTSSMSDKPKDQTLKTRHSVAEIAKTFQSHANAVPLPQSTPATLISSTSHLHPSPAHYAGSLSSTSSSISSSVATSPARSTVTIMPSASPGRVPVRRVPSYLSSVASSEDESGDDGEVKGPGVMRYRTLGGDDGGKKVDAAAVVASATSFLAKSTSASPGKKTPVVVSASASSSGYSDSESDKKGCSSAFRNGLDRFRNASNGSDQSAEVHTVSQSEVKSKNVKVEVEVKEAEADKPKQPAVKEGVRRKPLPVPVIAAEDDTPLFPPSSAAVPAPVLPIAINLPPTTISSVGTVRERQASISSSNSSVTYGSSPQPSILSHPAQHPPLPTDYIRKPLLSPYTGATAGLTTATSTGSETGGSTVGESPQISALGQPLGQHPPLPADHLRKLQSQYGVVPTATTAGSIGSEAWGESTIGESPKLEESTLSTISPGGSSMKFVEGPGDRVREMNEKVMEAAKKFAEQAGAGGHIGVNAMHLVLTPFGYVPLAQFLAISGGSSLGLEMPVAAPPSVVASVSVGVGTDSGSIKEAGVDLEPGRGGLDLSARDGQDFSGEESKEAEIGEPRRGGEIERPVDVARASVGSRIGRVRSKRGSVGSLTGTATPKHEDEGAKHSYDAIGEILDGMEVEHADVPTGGQLPFRKPRSASMAANSRKSSYSEMEADHVAADMFEGDDVDKDLPLPPMPLDLIEKARNGRRSTAESGSERPSVAKAAADGTPPVLGDRQEKKRRQSMPTSSSRSESLNYLEEPRQPSSRPTSAPVPFAPPDILPIPDDPPSDDDDTDSILPGMDAMSFAAAKRRNEVDRELSSLSRNKKGSMSSTANSIIAFGRPASNAISPAQSPLTGTRRRSASVAPSPRSREGNMDPELDEMIAITPAPSTPGPRKSILKRSKSFTKSSPNVGGAQPDPSAAFTISVPFLSPASPFPAISSTKSLPAISPDGTSPLSPSSGGQKNLAKKISGFFRKKSGGEAVSPGSSMEPGKDTTAVKLEVPPAPPNATFALRSGWLKKAFKKDVAHVRDL
ncbi:hypothetical protein HDU97_004821 [Phlyctochytrium planicorne]|nr:hypothetical protein HDU97_004821 [Phlyctochytrium planicorne]